MLSSFEDFEFKSDDGVIIDRVKSFKYLGVTTDETWNWKPHIRNFAKKVFRKKASSEESI